MKTLAEAAKADLLKIDEGKGVTYPDVFKRSSVAPIIKWFKSEVVGKAMENDFNTAYDEITKNSKTAGVKDDDNIDEIQERAFEEGIDEINNILEETIDFFAKQIRAKFKY